MKLKDYGLTAPELKEKTQKYMIELADRFPFVAETAKGMYVYDSEGRAYLDFYAGIAVDNAGHCNDKVVAAVQEQVAQLMHVFSPCWPRGYAPPSAWIRYSIRTPALRPTRP